MLSIDDVTYIASGAYTTLLYSGIAYIFGLIFGSILGFARTVKRNFWIKKIANSYVSFVMGVPVMVQVMAVYYALPAVTGLKISGFISCCFALSANSSAYVSNVWVGGINALQRSEKDSAILFGIRPIRAYYELFLPVVVRNQLPSLLGELSSLIKETVVVSMVGEEDIMRRAYMVASRKFDYIGAMAVAAVVYYIIVSTLNYISNIVESYADR